MKENFLNDGFVNESNNDNDIIISYQIDDNKKQIKTSSISLDISNE